MSLLWIAAARNAECVINTPLGTLRLIPESSKMMPLLKAPSPNQVEVVYCYRASGVPNTPTLGSRRMALSRRVKPSADLSSPTPSFEQRPMIRSEYPSRSRRGGHHLADNNPRDRASSAFTQAQKRDERRGA